MQQISKFRNQPQLHSEVKNGQNAYACFDACPNLVELDQLKWVQNFTWQVNKDRHVHPSPTTYEIGPFRTKPLNLKLHRKCLTQWSIVFYENWNQQVWWMVVSFEHRWESHHTAPHICVCVCARARVCICMRVFQWDKESLEKRMREWEETGRERKSGAIESGGRRTCRIGLGNTI